jgi:hypothetical protein
MKAINSHDNSGVSGNQQAIEMLKNGQLLSLGSNHSAGLILQKPYYAEFIELGAAIGGMFDLQVVAIHTLGKVELQIPETAHERQDALQKRMENIEQMQQICEQDAPIDRAVGILELLSQKFHQEEIQMIPNDVLAKLVGVLPSTMAVAWQKLAQSSQSQGNGNSTTFQSPVEETTFAPAMAA